VERKIASDPMDLADGNRSAIEAANQMVAEGDLNLFFTGKAGRGKSRLAHTIVLNSVNKMVYAKFWTITRFLLTLKTQALDTDEIQAIDDMLKPKILVLDDFGATKITEWNLMMMDTIFDDWYRERRTGLVVNSNFSISEISQKISDRIASRLAEMCEVIEIGGGDWRVRSHA
jgi:DNA replication protein DnaC